MLRPKSIADYDKAIQLDPKYAAAYNNRGIAHYARGELDNAITDFVKALQLRPDFAAAYNNRGLARKTQGDLAGAIADSERYLALGGGEKYGNRAAVERVIRELRRKLGQA